MPPPTSGRSGRGPPWDSGSLNAEMRERQDARTPRRPIVGSRRPARTRGRHALGRGGRLARSPAGTLDPVAAFEVPNHDARSWRYAAHRSSRPSPKPGLGGTLPLRGRAAGAAMTEDATSSRRQARSPPAPFGPHNRDRSGRMIECSGHVRSTSSFTR